MELFILKKIKNPVLTISMEFYLNTSELIDMLNLITSQRLFKI